MVVDPPPMKKFPLDREAAGFNIPYAVGGAMIKDRADYKYYHEDPLDDPEIMEFVRCFDYKPDPESDYPIHFPGELQVTLKNGQKIAKRIVASKGSPEWPMTPSEVENKFLDHALRVMTRGTANRLIETVMSLEKMADVSMLLNATSADAA
jgi:2-methylcitrate dehydratase PrpD